MTEVIPFPVPKPPQTVDEQLRRRAYTFQHLMDRLAFLGADKKAAVYVRCGWMSGVVHVEYREDGVHGKPTVLLYLNEDEMPDRARSGMA